MSQITALAVCFTAATRARARGTSQLDYAIELMKRRQKSRLLLVDELNQLAGVLSMTDVTDIASSRSRSQSPCCAQ